MYYSLIIKTDLDSLLNYTFYFFVFFFAFFWLAMVIWTINDVLERSENFLFQLLAVTIVMTFHVIGLILYIIFRPARTLEELRFNELEEKLLLSSVPTTLNCPQCEKIIEPDYLFCPHCQKRVKQKCSSCNATLALDFEMCPYCQNPIKKHKAKK